LDLLGGSGPESSFKQNQWVYCPSYYGYFIDNFRFISWNFSFQYYRAGLLRAPLLLTLGARLLVGILAQPSRLCTVGALRDLFLIKIPIYFLVLLGYLPQRL